jgi:hypothetical protein
MALADRLVLSHRNPSPGPLTLDSYGVDAAFMLLEEAAEKVWRIPACLPALRSI